MPRSSGEISSDLFSRYRGNPLLTPERWPYAVNAVFNPAAAEVDGTTVLLCRVEDRRGISHLTVARSRDGISNWIVDEHPLIEPEPDAPHEAWGVEDPRITWVPELEKWVIAFTSFGPGGPGLSMATTSDFRTAERLGMVRAAGGQERRPAAAPDQRRVRPVPSSGDRPDPSRRHLALPLGRPTQLVRAGTGHGRSAGRLVGLRSDRHRPTADRDLGGVAAHLPRRTRDRGRRALPRRSRAARPGGARLEFSGAAVNGCSARGRATSWWAMSPAWSFRAG